MTLPGATIGILGGGQLGRMLGVAARQLGYGVGIFAPEGDNPAEAVASTVVRAPYEDADAVRAFAARCAVLTYEFENVPAETVRAAAAVTPVFPSAALLGHTQDRLAEHALLDRLGIPHAAGRAVRTPEELDRAVAELGRPSRLKTARGGYDGGGQWPIRTDADLVAARAAVDGTRAFRVERDVPFDREVSVVVARGADGRCVPFPLFENEHTGGILHRTTWPARASALVESRARAIAFALAEAVDLRGTLTVECFVVGQDVLVNELAPRVHNSGHLTIEACAVSQFEQHLRAICGLPLADPTPRGPACMVNLLGDTARAAVELDLADALALPELHLHLYGKATVRARRKMGHLTALAATREEAVARAEAGLAAVRFR